MITGLQNLDRNSRGFEINIAREAEKKSQREFQIGLANIGTKFQILWLVLEIAFRYRMYKKKS